jgi:hypothetical protein
MAHEPLPFRALELHGQGIWRRDRVSRALRFMQSHGLNALVLHESDLVHHVVYPRSLFDPHALWRDAPSRRGENAIFNNRAYLESVIAQARAAGIETWLNVKEIGFSDEVLALRPEVFKAGAICPSEPFWAGYVAAKTDELLGDFPGLAGVIVSFGSQESRASRAQNRCRCALCAAEPLEGWYGRIIAAMHDPVRRHGRRLAVRDFAYKPEDHRPLVAAPRAAGAGAMGGVRLPRPVLRLGPHALPGAGRLGRTRAALARRGRLGRGAADRVGTDQRPRRARQPRRAEPDRRRRPGRRRGGADGRGGVRALAGGAWP